MRKVIITWRRDGYGFVTLRQQVFDGEREDALVETEIAEVSLRERELSEIVEALDAGTSTDGRFEYGPRPKCIGRDVDPFMLGDVHPERVD